MSVSVCVGVSVCVRVFVCVFVAFSNRANANSIFHAGSEVVIGRQSIRFLPVGLGYA